MSQETMVRDTGGLSGHLWAIQSLSEKHNMPVEIVAELYRSELDLLAKSARITDYLSVFVSRRVGALLQDLKSATSACLPFQEK